MKFLDFLTKKNIAESNLKLMNEAISDKNFEKAMDLITSMFKKNISRKLLRFENPLDCKVDGKNCKCMIFVVDDKDTPQVFTLNWLNSTGSNEVYSISIFDSCKVLATGKDKAKVTIYTMGASIVYFMPLIYHAINNKDYKLNQQSLEKYAKNILVKESFRQFFIGNLHYNIFEGLTDEYIEEQYINNICDRVFEEASEELKKAKKEIYTHVKDIYSKHKELKAQGKINVWKNIEHDYYEIVRAIKGGAETIEDLDIEFRSDIVIEILKGKTEIEAEKEIEQRSDDPESAWKELRQYIKMVIKGLNPSVIVCGAPGAGKTFRIKQELKAAKYEEGRNLCTIKGKCSPRQLYLALYEFQNKGDIILIDDADSLVGPKAPEDVINILKGALDSTSDDEGRLVSYMVAGKLLDDEGTPVPKKFYYRGSVIIITNYRAGQLDTALRGRSFIQDINFSTQDMLKIIEKVMPNMGDGKISEKSKKKAFDYISGLAKNKNNDIEISMRTFNICATLYESADNDPDFTEEETNAMIKKLLKLQAARGGKKY